ncbi:hypothetical protein GJ700_02495 [Duganella sp. FT92W]|uniref:Uncharacterized protein n=1 Tax=Pseudoduganella rivuli TaxID=2666085 RepID=A0A7X2IJ12_9BURK|nr:hypothetical protein [Pseudoduganella rivuli]MRV70588.1 hypothetical protein [Pseudoduganella rivuli]
MKQILTMLFMLISLGNAVAVSLNGRPTDDSVCDLGTMTTYRLGRITFVDGNTQQIDKIFVRLALRFISKSCRDGQELIMHSDFGTQMDENYFRDVATLLCGAANIKREVLATSEQPHAFQVKCTIVKLRTATAWLTNAESDKSTEAMIAEGAPSRQSGVPPDDKTPTLPKCSERPRFGPFILGVGGGACRD